MDVTGDLFLQAASLPPEQREELAFRLLKTLPEFDESDAPFVLSDEEELELERRSDRHRANPRAARSAEEALTELRSLVEGSANEGAD